MSNEISFAIRGDIIRAGHFAPRHSSLANSQGSPCVVMAHGLGGVRAAGLTPFAEAFAAAGLHVICFDYRGFGTSDGQPRQVVSVPMQLQDWAAAIEFARTVDDVDPARIATWGSSFSGGHAVAAAVNDGHVAAVSAQGAMMDGFAALQNVLRQQGLIHGLKLTRAGVSDAVRGFLGLPRNMLPVVAAPGAPGVLTTPDSEPGYMRIAPAAWRNEISTSWAVSLATYRPNLMTPRLPCPALFCIATEDVVVPPGAMEDGARRAPDKVRVKRYPVGHFDIYVPPAFDQVVADQTDFFVETLAA